MYVVVYYNPESGWDIQYASDGKLEIMMWLRLVRTLVK